MAPVLTKWTRPWAKSRVWGRAASQMASCRAVTWLGEADAARRAGATGHSARTQARNPPRVDLGARARRSSHKISPPRMASGLAVSSAKATCSGWGQARTTLMKVSPAKA